MNKEIDVEEKSDRNKRSTIMKHEIWVPIVVAAIMSGTSYYTLWKESPGSLKEGQKICSFVLRQTGDTWRDSTIVPNSWSIDTCNALRDRFETEQEKHDDMRVTTQLMCAFEDSVSSGDEYDKSPSLPSPNCGW